VWLGEEDNNYGSHAVISTLAITLKLMGLCETQEAALALAEKWWLARHDLNQPNE